MRWAALRPNRSGTRRAVPSIARAKLAAQHLFCTELWLSRTTYMAVRTSLAHMSNRLAIDAYSTGDQ